jgi:predicted transposase YdaD
MRESVIYQDILQQGLQQGRREGEATLILRQLTQQLGEVDSSLIEPIRRLSTEQLEALGIALLDFSEMADLVAWLQQQEVSD